MKKTLVKIKEQLSNQFKKMSVQLVIFRNKLFVLMPTYQSIGKIYIVGMAWQFILRYSKPKNIMILVLWAMLFVAVAVNVRKKMGFLRETQKVLSHVASVETAAVVARDRQSDFKYIGKVRRPSVTLKAPAPGTIYQVCCEPGQVVKKGQLLILLDDAKETGLLQETEARVKSCQEIYLAYQQLNHEQEGAVSAVELAKACGELEMSRGRHLAQQAICKQYEIRAPFDGFVSAQIFPNVDLRPGGYVHYGTELVTVCGENDGTIIAQVPEENARSMVAGDDFSILDEKSDKEIAGGSISVIDVISDANSHNVWVTGVITRHNIKLFANQSVVIRSSMKPKLSLVMPSDGIVLDDYGNTYAYVVGLDGTLKKQQIKIVGERSKDGCVTVLYGLSIGDLVVISNHNALYHGKKVIVRNTIDTGLMMQ